MKVSELIQKLQGAQMLWGDLEVKIWEDYLVGPLAIKEVADERDDEGAQTIAINVEAWEVEAADVVPDAFVKLQQGHAMPLEEFNLNYRTQGSLLREGIFTAGDLTKYTMHDLLKMEWVGRESVDKIEKKLATMGLGLKEWA